MVHLKKIKKTLLIFFQSSCLIFSQTISYDSISNSGTPSNAYSVSSSDLGQNATIILGDGSGAGINQYLFGSTATALNNGSFFGNAVSASSTSDTQVSVANLNVPIQFVLGNGNLNQGFSLNQISIYAGSGAGQDRADLVLTIEYSTISQTTTFSTLTTLNYTAPSFNTNSKGDVTNFSLNNIYSLRFTQTGGLSTMYREIDIFGNSSNFTMPISVNLTTYSNISSVVDSFPIDGSSSGTGSGKYSQVNSTGAVILNGGTLKPQTQFTGSSGFIPSYGQPFNLINGSSLTGTFSTIDNSANPSSLRFVAEYTPTQVNVYAVPGDYSRDIAGLSGSQKAVGGVLNQIVGSSVDLRSSSNTKSETIARNIIKLNSSQIQVALRELDPVQFEGLSQNTFSSLQSIQGGLQGRFDQIQSGTAGGVTFNGAPLLNLSGESEYESLADIGLPYVVRKRKTPLNFFIKSTGTWGEVETSANRLGYDYQDVGNQIGADYRFNNGTTLGLTLWQGTGRSLINASGSTLESNRGGGGIYAHQEWRGFYVGGYAGAGKVFYDTQRKINFLGETAEAETEAILAQGSMETGYEMRYKNWGFGPTMGLSFDQIWQEGFSEKRSAAALDVKDQESQSLRSWVGARVQSVWKSGKWQWIPQSRVGWQHEYMGNNEIESKFQAGGGWIRSKSDALDRDTLTTQIGLTCVPHEQWSLSTSYRNQLLAKDFSYNAIDFSVRFGF